MPRTISPTPLALNKPQARRIWLHAQRLDTHEPFGAGPAATPAAVEHLGYVQIDTIHVIERCHHHILYTRIPDYERDHLRRAQSIDKTLFEYWTHALAYVPVADLRYFIRQMKRHRQEPRSRWFEGVADRDVRNIMARIRNNGPLSIRDIEDDVLVEKDHAWASRKPSKRALQLAFYRGQVAVSQRTGMLKTYELMTRHFGRKHLPAAASENEITHYLLDRALRSQGLVSLDSICHLNAPRKPSMRRLIEARVRRQELLPVEVEGTGTQRHWIEPATFERARGGAGQQDRLAEQSHILSPFDPLVIQRKRLRLFFDYEHRFEAYLPKEKRIFGYFACPVLVGDRIVAAIDLKTDRESRRLLVQKWTWLGKGTARRHRKTVEDALHRFERFQLAR